MLEMKIFMVRTIIFFSVVYFLGGCAANNFETGKINPPEKKIYLGRISAKTLFKMGCNYLSPAARAPDYTNALQVFTLLIESYPDTQYAKMSSGIAAAIECLLKEKAEIITLKKNQAIIKKESEQLKLDIQRLKELDIELGEKEKFLR